MIKILSAEQIRQWDEFTIQKEPVSSIDLMERASAAFVQEFTKRVTSDASIEVICGPGNNGGDGFAIARMLQLQGFRVKCFLIDFGAKLSVDCRTNYNRFSQNNEVTIIRNSADLALEADLILDALFGSGLNRPINGLAAEVIVKVNQFKAKKVALDIPSGLFADKVELQTEVFKADWTITFQVPKLTFLIPETGFFVGEWTAVSIGLRQDFLEGIQTDYYLLEKSDIKPEFFWRKKFDHKGVFGKVLLIAGSKGKMGAAFLAAKACLRSGAGLLTVHIPSSGNAILQSLLPEAMVSLDEHEDYSTKLNEVDGYDVIAVGPGIGTNKATGEMLNQLLSSMNKPMVFDADALNLLSRDNKLLDMIPEHSILTPHLGEYNRLFGEAINGLDRIRKISSFAEQKKLVIILKGAHTAIAGPFGKVYFNSTGNAGMATAGSGDVLTGILTAFMARKIESVSSAMLGVYIHGWAGDLAQNKVGKTSLMASDLLCNLPEVLNNVDDSNFI
ncbi:MAG: bifunctional ADP-dependent NAD(P)H-hydrate dehydratase/NAD(P)H-hydrate epimerase [Cytophagales bacterium CG12_big_fil_rev_8_21_14_0_65_40_12]|nr:MAG: bifunctional ADP-dependent NAD(P)H-hydrate dehydratase/NAD(P)H-hydrate epimerase [Cytophagales bacterium CG12_big_fil_rev_8_21_14_0_65_40_12]PIW06220.1 MAG: bifunctional ADP-dependent NAD(P)H-hydrate dehydratase/NAD(P)H-hydrate epimerase [Cytophagales bacterium CG17_big_fil_post_rev_8_21_14_2_50_40_13]